MKSERVPDCDALDSTVHERFEQVAAQARNASRLAIHAQDAQLSYGELSARVRATACGIVAAGVRPEERVGIMAEPTAQLVCALLGVMGAAAVPCPMEQNLSHVELRRRINAAGIRTLVLDRLRYHALREADEFQDVRMLPIDLLAATKTVPLPAAAPDSGALALFTSGSTGASKAVLLTHRNLLANAYAVAEATELGADDRLLNFMPLYHTNSLCNQLLAPLLVGATVILMPRFRVEAVEHWLREHRPTYFTGVPTIYFRLLQHPLSADALRSLRFARCGSAPISPTLHEQVEQQLGVPLIVSYGCTEATCTTTINPPRQRRIGTVGKVIRYQEVGFRTAGGDVSTAPGVVGEVCIRGETLMKALLPGPAPDSEGYPIRDGWLRTGDIGCLDEDGYLTLTGKAKNIIVRGGENLSPELIEDALLAHPEILKCCVVGVPDEEYGEVPVAYVVLTRRGRRDGIELAAADRVRARLSAANVPKFFQAVDHLPENSVGKIDRLRLADMARQNLSGA
jgi:acyl-CoA synthetase (AMP-forming)/AMP-acid ligase II